MKPWEVRYRDALDDPNVSVGLLAFQRGWRTSRDARIDELERSSGMRFDELREQFATVKRDALADWDGLIDRFTRAAESAGATVVRVSDAAAALDYIGELTARAGTRVVVKGKSMVSEEIGLNAYLEGRGVTPVETDLGEWLLQIAGEHPSHLVMPAIHKRAEQIATLLEQVLGRPFDPRDIDGMVKVVRGELRDRFLTAGMGLSGANALIAEGGTVMLVCNEGNNRMSVALPPVHVVAAGIEKLVPAFSDAIAQVRLLARSATGQTITTYTNFVTGPRPGQEQHILLLDNGRSTMAADPDISAALGCMRCGACANVCPPYQVVGGHAFGHIYTGAIGLVNTPYHHGIEAASGPQSLCVSCGACATVCPSDIPLPDQILEVRRGVATAERDEPASRIRRAGLRAFAHRRVFAVAVAAAAIATAPLRRDGVLRLGPLRSLPGVATRTDWRDAPALPMRPGRRKLRATSPPARLDPQPLAGRNVMLFLQCLADRVSPDVVVATASLLHAMGGRVLVPQAQHCCGLPAFDAGDWDIAGRMAGDLLDTFAGVDDVVTPAPSCLTMLQHHAPRLFRDDPVRLAQARDLHARVFDLVGYLTGPAGLPAGALDDGDRTPVTVHRFCQSSNVLGRSDSTERLLASLCNVEAVPLAEAEVCCGFGGSVSLTAPEVSAGILERKVDNVVASGAHVVISDNPGCLVHLRGGITARGERIEVLHLAEYLARRLPAG